MLLTVSFFGESDPITLVRALLLLNGLKTFLLLHHGFSFLKVLCRLFHRVILVLDLGQLSFRDLPRVLYKARVLLV